MGQQASEEIGAREALDHLLACVVSDPKRDDPLAVTKHILFRDHTSTKVETKIDQCLISSAIAIVISLFYPIGAHLQIPEKVGTR